MPAERSQEGVYISSREPFRRAAIFPHGKHQAKIRVVSERAIRQVHELTKLASDASSGMKCAVLFVVNRGDCSFFRPCHEACPLFAQVLKHASEQGVHVMACDVNWKGSQCYFGKTLPVVFDAVSSKFDQDWLADVLEADAAKRDSTLLSSWSPRSTFLTSKQPRKRKHQEVSTV